MAVGNLVLIRGLEHLSGGAKLIVSLDWWRVRELVIPGRLRILDDGYHKFQSRHYVGVRSSLENATSRIALHVKNGISQDVLF